MNVKELDKTITEILEKTTKELIKERIDSMNNIVDKFKSFQSLAGLVPKMTNIEDKSNGHFAVNIYIEAITPDELLHCCGGTNMEEAEKNLMQNLHHDLAAGGMGNDFDIDIDANGNGQTVSFIIKITSSEQLGDTNMEEKVQNPEMDEKKEIILGDKKVETNEQFEELAAELGPVLQNAAAQYIGGKVAEKLSTSDDEQNEQEEVSEDKNWIQKAVNPKHKGYCTPMTKKTCTPRRKALAKRFKKGIETNESTGKKYVRLSEDQMKEVLMRIIDEAVPGVDTTKRVTTAAGKQNADALKAVEKKIRDYLDFKGNDNPEFPHQAGQGDEKVARQNSKEQDQLVSDNRGRGMQDLNYDQEPSKKFKERLKLSLVGDSLMGNSHDAANVIKTDVGKKVYDNIEKRQDNFKKEPIYEKEPIPVNTGKEKPDVRPKHFNVPADKEMARMKQLTSYNKKTQ